MKLVARVPFSNPGKLGLDPEKYKLKHPMHIPRGTRIELAPDFKSIEKLQPMALRELIAELVGHRFVVVDDGSPQAIDAIAEIEKQVKEEAAQLKAQAAAAEPLSISDQIAAGVVAAINALKLKPA